MRPDPRNSRAVLVGTASYTMGLPQMRHAAANLVDLSIRLEGILAPGTIIQCVDPTGASAVLDRLGALADQRLDLLLFYYAGHGVRDADDRLCLALPGSVDNGHDARRTSLPAEAVFALLRRSPAVHRVVVLDCCYAGLAMDEPTAADLHLLTACGRTEKARFDDAQRNTAFTGELIRLLDDGVPDGPEWLHLDQLYRHLEVMLGAPEMPVPQQRTVNLSGDLVLARNRGYGTARSADGLRARAHFANQVGLVGRPAQAAGLFATLVADAPQVAAFRRAHARWIGESGEPEAAVAILDELITTLPPGPDLNNALRSRDYWADAATA